ncbi:uncharacterized protein M421DRAFT_425811 [Didymella exigua CBS 183.55]|uniref:CFEM domain-containing protein n=1 Tax=Didymella exigua CBS 183.55 TaxID=1150837 RepID=A0A6A5RCE6_9PLEO|nr:uncharacterized protein M421DRAFT_425811 [Didymella exigua CBS 183.55]KAF1923437.1 hypothetical protein M421DRAFT_425811 [Didymella exigua CBS 183.55]
MKNALILSAITAFVTAQSIVDLPSCSLQCLAAEIPALGCELTDFACSCKQADKLTPNVTPCVQSSCTDAADQAKTIEVLSAICAAAGFPIEAPAPTSEAAGEPTSEAPIETQPSVTGEPEYSAYPTEVPPVSYPAPDYLTSDVPNLPSSYSEYEPIPSSVVVSRPSPHTTSVPGVLPPYPISVEYPSGSPEPSVPGPTGTGVHPTTSSSLPEFTGAAMAAKIPVVAAGVFGLAAFVL